ncbi:MAG: TlpA disulfide reductase family protein [Acidobacteriota bacterium]
MLRTTRRFASQTPTRLTPFGFFLVAMVGLVTVCLGPVAAHAASGSEVGNESQPPMDFRVLAADGRHVGPVELFDGPTLVDFWATWCAPCVESMPQLESLHRELAGVVDVVGISVDRGFGGGVKARRFAERLGVTYPIYHDFTRAPARVALNIVAVPVLLLIDADGRVIERWDGEADFAAVKSSALRLAAGPADGRAPDRRRADGATDTPAASR